MATSFAPSEIARSTVSMLLSLYPGTVREVYRDKVIAKLQPKLIKQGQKNTVQTKGPGSFNEIEKTIEKEVSSFLKLDAWRYETLPAVLRERAGKVAMDDEEMERPGKKAKKSKKVEGAFLEKDELVQLMDWKLYVTFVHLASSILYLLF
jgi:hypothetical protein